MVLQKISNPVQQKYLVMEIVSKVHFSWKDGNFYTTPYLLAYGLRPFGLLINLHVETASFTMQNTNYAATNI